LLKPKTELSLEKVKLISQAIPWKDK